MLIEQPQLWPEVSIRWLTIACFEIRVGDFRIVIDPCIGESPRAPFGPEVIEGAMRTRMTSTRSRRIWSWTSAARGCARCLPAIRTSTAHMRT